ncbi:MAG: preprotein translocase subunit SecE [Candidatus Dadabacteria bacterium]|nr:MAG: preprotein translocase subunit SecE [Candidatus Dadabacteria bacterium]
MAESKKNIIRQVSEFFSESVDELKKVSTPTRQETIQATMVTLLIMVVVSLSLLIMDWIFSNITSWLFDVGI